MLVATLEPTTEFITDPKSNAKCLLEGDKKRCLTKAPPVVKDSKNNAGHSSFTQSSKTEHSNIHRHVSSRRLSFGDGEF